MEHSSEFANLVASLQSALGLIDFESNASLRQDALNLCDYLADPVFRIAVFGPFNHGKSTLLNALLGSRTLPIDLIPTTGAAIAVRYGTEINTRITLSNGREIVEPGTDILKQYAILDDQRRMRGDVTGVHVTYPHPFLQTGIEFLDLPGTNDREAQEMLVRDRLFTCDLIIQVLDARKLMTLGEREHLRDWLLDREIKSIVFVVNFLNLLEPDEQKEVFHRLRFVAESFRADLPSGISNLYRVDALPALRARLKGDTSAAQVSGLAAFESALQAITAAQQERLRVRLPRIQAIASQIQQQLQAKVEAYNSELVTAKEKQQAKIAIQQKAEKLIRQGFQASASELESWLYLPKLLERYQSELAMALRQGQFETWQTQRLQSAIAPHEQSLNQWLDKGCEFFQQQHPGALKFPYPSPPQVTLPKPPQTATSKSDSDLMPVALSTGIGWILGGPVGAAVVGGASYLIGRTPSPKSANSPSESQILQAYQEAAEDYLTHLNIEWLASLRDYQQKLETIICYKSEDKPLESTPDSYQIQLAQSLIDNLSLEIEKIGRL
ncbi:dynamin family protein [Geitlerinema splendidum]|nr:dynamin family protein [Geitlerinema splendidum]